MKLKEAAERRYSYFLFEQSNDIFRLIVQVFVYDEGVVIVDPFWTEPGTHPFHTVPGKITGEGPSWKIGDHIIKLIDNDRHGYISNYEEFLAHPDGSYETKENARKEADRYWKDYVENDLRRDITQK
jgi:hypothetical protein